MRIYMDVEEALEEIKRDVAEMGINVYPKTMQDKVIEGDSNYFTKELQNYAYTISNANSLDVPGVSQPWADAEFLERIHMIHLDGEQVEEPVNPGEAYKLRDEVWNEFLHDGKFGYSYNERIHHNNQLVKVIQRLKDDNDSRQIWLSLWDPSIDPDNLGGVSRVPCSLGYAFQIREGKVNIHYIMRSCDYVTHLRNDIYLAIRLLEYVSTIVNLPVGDFTHTVFSLHAYAKDMEGVF